MALRLAGNDVVDLGDPANVGAYARPRFVARVCGAREREAVAASPDPAGLLWSFFAAKEAAFKVVCKMGPRPVFAHRRFVVGPSLSSVRYEEVVLRLSVERAGDRIHAVAWTGGEPPLAIAATAGAAEDLGLAARRLLVESLARSLGCSPAMLVVVREPAPEAWDDLGPPRLLRYGKPVDVDVSLSHDGRFVAIAACVGATAAGPTASPPRPPAA